MYWKKGLTALSIPDFKTWIEKDAIILDTRNADIFPDGFVPGSVSIGLEGRFAEWAGSLLSFDEPIILVTEPGREKETIIRLARVGFDKIKGYLNGGYESWQKSGEPIDLVINIEPDELMMDIPFDDKLIIMDVRKPVEFAEGHLKNALNVPLNDLNDPANMANITEENNVYVHCAGGYRSIIAASLLKRQGIHNLRNVAGGWAKIKEEEKAEIVKEKSVLN